MADDNFIREPRQILAFADKLGFYVEDMRAACKTARQHIDDAEPFMKDQVGKAAISTLNQLLDDLESGLPTCETLVKKLVLSGKLGIGYLEHTFKC